MERVLAALMLVALPLATPCFGLGVPQDAEIVRPFAPVGLWAGHWGVDIAAPLGSDVAAIGAGVVRYGGRVVSNTTVSVDHGGGVVSAYSYLGEVAVRKGQRVYRGMVVGVSGVHDAREAFHLSVRVSGKYVDPAALSRCSRAPRAGLYLAVREPIYAVERARDPRRHLRPAPHRSSRHGQGGARPARA